MRRSSPIDLSPYGADRTALSRRIFPSAGADATVFPRGSHRAAAPRARSGASVMLVLLGWLAGPTVALGGLGDAPPPAPARSVLQRHVATLASAEYGGRAGSGARRAARYIIDRFAELELEPLFGDAYEQPVSGFGPDKEAVIGYNVGAVIRGSDSRLRDEWIIISAHYDHLGVRGALFPGADDNASGVAMLLEAARCVSAAEGEARPKRSIAFVAYDLEERGLWGSRYFAEHAPFELERLKLFITADMIGRSLGGVCDEFVFVMGTEHAPELRPWVQQGAEGLSVVSGIVGSDLLLFDRSDYGPFRKRQIPYIFFSTGESPVYHTPEDRPETLDYEKLTEISQLIIRVLREAARSETAPSWRAQPEHAIGEAVAVRFVLDRILQNAQLLGVSKVQSSLLKSQISVLEQAIERGHLTPTERRRMVINAQLVLYSIL